MALQPHHHAHRSSAWPLMWAFFGLIVYASLHPFTGWQLPQPLNRSVLSLPWTFYNQRWDNVSNFLAYLPLGLLACTAWRRDGAPAWLAVAASCLLGTALSYAMELAQHALPTRVPSRLDWILNTAGVSTGALAALAINRLGWVDAWRGLRNRWFRPGSGSGQTLLLLWPLALLFPPPVPLGVGQVLDRLNEAAVDLLADTQYAGWLPERYGFEALSPSAEMLAVALGLLAPTLVAAAVARSPLVRLILLLGAVVLGVAATTLSTALNFGPDHALSWMTPPVLPGITLGLALGCACAWLPRRASTGIGLIALTALVTLVNQAPSDPYYALSLQAWEQGRFIRFHGLAQWIGWLWPYLAIIWLLIQISMRDGAADRLPTIGP